MCVHVHTAGMYNVANANQRNGSCRSCVLWNDQRPMKSAKVRENRCNEMKWNEMNNSENEQKANAANSTREKGREWKAHHLYFRLCFSPILLWQRQFFDYFPLNLTAIFTSHFDSFLLHIASYRLLTIHLHVTLVHSVGNNHEALATWFFSSSRHNNFILTFGSAGKLKKWKLKLIAARRQSEIKKIRFKR